MHPRTVRKLAGRLAVSFGLGLTIVTTTKPAVADTITGYIFSNILNEQTSNSAPATPSGYFFSIGADFVTPGDYTAATATYPGSGSPAVLPPDSPTEFNVSSPLYSSSSALQSAYPFGTYTITASGTAGSSTSSINYTANYFTGSVPYVTDYSSLTGLNPSQSFSVDYNAFTPDPNVTEGFTFFTIYNALGAAVFSDEFQPDTSTGALIAAGILSPDTAYTYELDYSDRLNGGSGPFTVQGFDVRTDGSFTTGAAATPLPPTWTMMLAGIAGFGFIAHRRKKSRSAGIAAA